MCILFFNFPSKTCIGLLIDQMQHQAAPIGLKSSTSGNKIIADCQNCCYHFWGISGEKDQKCDLCDFRSAYPRALRRHKMMHTVESGDKTYDCDECDFVTTHSEYLKRHKMIHATEKLFKVLFLSPTCNILNMFV